MSKIDLNSVIGCGEKIYRHINPKSKMDVPSMFYEALERKHKVWSKSESKLSFYDYCINELK